ncbi:left-right determination factor S homeolog precursor [Xenopus laevis]|uniref:Left-right determination factor n=1 Tax=Xenopus laevis TaxID=8355 RepID=Q9DFC5_XENLA|nr:left-right determination factor S homeolog precursor [Xenopus laevis]AAG10035.1 TGF-beta family member lefty-B [Xenopus laevis]AAI69650.1 TGF-beta family member lefty-B [Xenopus laevis]AAI69652.1 TGF-beta family member lefty-B [Xenopus laevis]
MGVTTKSLRLCLIFSTLCLAGISAFNPDDIRDALLKKLNLQEVPKLEKRDVENLVIPRHIQAKYMSMLHNHRERKKRSLPSLAGILRGISGNADISGEILYSDSSKQSLVFGMESRIPENSEVTMAELKLFKKPPKIMNVPERRFHRPVNNARVSVYYVEILKDGTNRTSLVDSRLVPIMESGWRSFDVTQAVHYWMRSGGQSSMHLEIHVDGERHGSHASEMAKMVRFTTQSPSDNSLGKPELVLFTLNLNEQGTRGDCSASGAKKDNICCREEYFINFRELTWTQYWIIEPAGYNAFRCTGSCKQPKYPLSHYHYGQRTCAVVESAPLPVMYLVKKGDYTEIEVAEFPNMIVEKCGCTMDNIAII